MPRKNRHRGSSFDRFLKDQGMYEDAQAAAVKRAIAEAITEGMLRAGLSKLALARRMRTSRSQLDRVLDPACTAVQLDSVVRAAAATGQELRISFRKAA
jgi:predicted XRE-type DNA-binding protein